MAFLEVKVQELGHIIQQSTYICPELIHQGTVKVIRHPGTATKLNTLKIKKTKLI